MMKNYDQSVDTYHNPNWPYIPDHSYRILIIGGSGSEKINVLLNLIKNQRSDIDNIHLYVKDPFKSKYQLLINGKGKVGIKKLKNPKALIDYSQTIDDVYENLQDHNLTKKRRVLVVFGDIASDIKVLQGLTTRFWIFTTEFFVIMSLFTARWKGKINRIINGYVTFK